MRTRRTAHGTKTPRLPSKVTPQNEDQEVTQDQRILKNPVNESEMRQNLIWLRFQAMRLQSSVVS